ncbi:hypothetical protein Bca101_037557 [Brassica carinata]
MAFVISPTRGLPGASSDQYLDEEFGDIDDNHVGININGLRSVVSASAGYYDSNDGSFKNLSLISGKVMSLSLVYSLIDKQLNVTLSSAELSVPPLKPLLSLNRDLSPYFSDSMYFGFTASTGYTGALHYMLVMFGSGDTGSLERDLNAIPILPPYPKKSFDGTRTVLAVCLAVSVIAVFIASWIGFVFYLRHKKVQEGFKDKKILGRGGFGQVYRGTLSGSDVDIAVKRISHGSSQGKSEFLAEISTIGRLRHPNLVRLLGYCRHKEDLFLVYDFMPNGSLDKYLNHSNTNENQERLSWDQRFKIIKDVASALLYLHQEWVQGIDPQTSKVAGTFGYIAPEFLRTGRATTSTDVYAFGLVILEVVCGRRLIERRQAKNEEVLVDWILELWENGKIFDAVEESIVQVEQNRGEIELPDNLLDVVRAENLRGRHEISVEVLLDIYSLSRLTFTHSSTSLGR